MLNSYLPAAPATHIEIQVNADLLSALQKLAEGQSISNAERFEIAALTFMTAKALLIKKRA
jgi:hypothetical protein